jgi:hypothetical protein
MYMYNVSTAIDGGCWDDSRAASSLVSILHCRPAFVTFWGKTVCISSFRHFALFCRPTVLSLLESEVIIILLFFLAYSSNSIPALARLSLYSLVVSWVVTGKGECFGSLLFSAARGEARKVQHPGQWEVSSSSYLIDWMVHVELLTSPLVCIGLYCVVCFSPLVFVPPQLTCQ